jgi:hypothetical protein
VGVSRRQRRHDRGRLGRKRCVRRKRRGSRDMGTSRRMCVSASVRGWETARRGVQRVQRVHGMGKPATLFAQALHFSRQGTHSCNEFLDQLGVNTSGRRTSLRRMGRSKFFVSSCCVRSTLAPSGYRGGRRLAPARWTLPDLVQKALKRVGHRADRRHRPRKDRVGIRHHVHGLHRRVARYERGSLARTGLRQGHALVGRRLPL